MPLKKRRRWSVTIESEADGEPSEAYRLRFWLQVILAVLGIAATLAVGAGLISL